jgi:hypothetical protein
MDASQTTTTVTSQTPKGSVAANTPFSEMKRAILVASQIIHRITENSVVRITEDGHKRIIE